LLLSSIIIFKNTKQTYGVNDDVIIQNWLSGFYTGRPELMIRGSATPRISFGFVVSNLYGLMPGINWFTIIIFSAIVFSWFLIGLLAYRSKNSLTISTYVVISFLHLFWFIPSPTYTAAAVMLSFSTLIFVTKKVSEHKLNSIFVFFSIPYVLGFLIRPESFLLGSAAAVPIILITLLRNKQIIREKMKFIVISIVMGLTILGIDLAFENIYYKNNSNWIEYKSWESVRYKIHANAPEKAVLNDPSKYGWTKAEAVVFQFYNYVDPEYFTTSKLEKLIIDSQKTTSLNTNFLGKAHQQIFDSEINWEWKRLINLITFIFLLFLIASFPNPFKFLMLSGSSLLVIYVVMLYVAGFLRQPERVQVSVIFLSILVSWTSFLFVEKSQHKNGFNQFVIISWLIFVLVIVNSYNQALYLKSRVAGASNVFWSDQISYLSKFPNDTIFVGEARQFRNNWISPYKVSYFDVEKRIFSFGWHNFSPHWVKRAENLGLDPNNMFQSVIQNPRVYWVSDPETMEYIVTFMKEQDYSFSGPEIVGEIKFVDDEYKVWNFNPSE
jgi:hypothetical protein